MKKIVFGNIAQKVQKINAKKLKAKQRNNATEKNWKTDTKREQEREGLVDREEQSDLMRT